MRVIKVTANSDRMAFVQFAAGVEIVLILIVAYRWRLWRVPELVRCCG